MAVDVDWPGDRDAVLEHLRGLADQPGVEESVTASGMHVVAPDRSVRRWAEVLYTMARVPLGGSRADADLERVTGRPEPTYALAPAGWRRASWLHGLRAAS